MSWYCPWCIEKRQKYEGRLEDIINYLLEKLKVKTDEDFEYFWVNAINVDEDFKKAINVIEDITTKRTR